MLALGQHDVRFVVIGGIAGAMHGSPYATFDLDVTPQRSAQNLARLAAALRQLGARVRTEGVEGGLAFDCSADFLGRVELLNLTTAAGDLDIAFSPSGTTGYDDLSRASIVVEIRGMSLEIAALDDIIRSKEAADRPKDRLVLPTLRAMRDRRDSEST